MKNKILLTMVGLLLLPAATSVAQVSNYQGGYWRSGYTMGWLRNEQVRKELEIVDYQVEKIEKVQTELQKKVQKLYAEIRKLPREEQGEKYREAQDKVKELYADAEKDLKEILLPAQVRRLEQVTTQMQMRNVSYGLRGELGEKLGLTEEQQKMLREKAAEKNQELYKKYAELRAEMQKELLGEVLTDEQQKQLDELIGEPFEFNAVQRSGAQGQGGKNGS